MHRAGQRFGKEELRGELVRLRRSRKEAKLEMRMYGAARVPARIHRDELREAGGIGDLLTAQELATRATP